MPFKFIEEVAIADVAFESSGNDLPELFESASQAVTATMVKDLGSVEEKTKKEIELEEEEIENLLHKFLEEIIYYKDAEKLLFSRFDIKIEKEILKWKLHAKIYGEELDPKKHELLVDVKAATWHHFKVEQTKEGWKAFVILDI